MTQVGSIYAQALYDLAAGEGLEDTILQQMDVLGKSFAAEPEYLRLLSVPTLTKEQRCQILDDGFRGKIQPYLLNFLKILTEKGYIRHFPDCCTAYREIYNHAHGILSVTAVTAVAITEDQHRRLSEKLASLTGKTIELHNRIDPACLGGVRLDYDGKRLDDTVSHRLEAVRSLLKNTVL